MTEVELLQRLEQSIKAIGLFGRRWLDRNDAAAYLKISEVTFDAEIRPHLTPHMIGRRAKFNKNEIDQVMESRAVDSDIED